MESIEILEKLDNAKRAFARLNGIWPNKLRISNNIWKEVSTPHKEEIKLQYQTVWDSSIEDVIIFDRECIPFVQKMVD